MLERSWLGALCEYLLASYAPAAEQMTFGWRLHRLSSAECCWAAQVVHVYVQPVSPCNGVQISFKPAPDELRPNFCASVLPCHTTRLPQLSSEAACQWMPLGAMSERHQPLQQHAE